jgi:predicted phosphohydrolase
MQKLVDQDAAQLKRDLIQACEQTSDKIMVLIHLPPFK